jgi:hypothetical protein
VDSVNNEVTNFGRFDFEIQLPQAVFIALSVKNQNLK